MRTGRGAAAGTVLAAPRCRIAPAACEGSTRAVVAAGATNQHCLTAGPSWGVGVDSAYVRARVASGSSGVLAVGRRDGVERSAASWGMCAPGLRLVGDLIHGAVLVGVVDLGRCQRGWRARSGRDSPPHLSLGLLRAASQVFVRWTSRRIPCLGAGGGACARLLGRGRIDRPSDRSGPPAPGKCRRTHTLSPDSGSDRLDNRPGVRLAPRRPAL
jgi:hypothetical protein